MKTAHVITVSTRAATGVYDDVSGAVLKDGLVELGYEVLSYDVVPDDFARISQAIKNGLEYRADLIVTSGGTGVSLHDITPEATKPLLEKEIPGFGEAFRAYSREKVPAADLTRGLTGISGKSLIINLPGSPNAVRDGLVIIKRLAHHIHDQLAGYDHIKNN